MSFGKRLIVLLLIAAMVAGIVYLGVKNNKVEEENKEMAYYQTETVYLWYSDDVYTDFFTNAAVEFHELNPDIRVIPTLVDSADYMENINRASLSEDNFPDLYVITNDSLEKAFLSGLASNISDDTHVLNSMHFPVGALSAVTYHDNYVGYPLDFDTTVLLYNKTYLEDWVEKVNKGETNASDMGSEFEEVTSSEPRTVTLEDYIPESFNDIASFAGEYEAPEGVDGILKWDVTDIFYSYFFSGKYMIVGGDAGDDTDNINIVNPETVNAITAYQSMNRTFSIDVATSDYDAMLKDFIDGKTVFTIVTSDAIKTINDALSEREEMRKQASSETGESDTFEETAVIPDFEYGYTLIPNVSDTLESRSLSVTDVVVINGYSLKKKAADKFAAYLTTQCAGNMYEKTGKLAASLDANYTDEAFKTFQDEYATSMPLPKIVEASNFWVQLEILFTNVWRGDDVNSALTILQNQIESQIVSE